MKIAISGASGLVGSALSEMLSSSGHKVYRLSRSRSDAPGSIYWNLETEEIDVEKLDGLDAVVHLAGESIASGRWNEAVKKRIWDSRIKGTNLLAEALCKVKNPPKVLVSASAMGYYGEHGDAWVTEETPGDESFLSRLCQEWEAAAHKVEACGIRVVCVRIGLVVSKEGGALKNMLLPFKLGLGGSVGSGRQYISWIMLEDLVRIFEFSIENEMLHGAINGVSPNPVTNREWTKALGKAVGRPTIFPVPSFVVKTILGEMGEALLLSSVRIKPQRLLDANFQFQHVDVEKALKAELA